VTQAEALAEKATNTPAVSQDSKIGYDLLKMGLMVPYSAL